MDKYYKILGLDNNTDLETVKKTYKKLAVKYHPDKNSDSDAQDKFKEITNAYHKILNPEKDDMFDNSDIDNLVNDLFGNFMPNYEMHLGNIFNQVFTENNQNNINKNLGKDILKVININLEDIFIEKTILISYDSKKINKNFKKCSFCNGTGFIISTQQLGPMMMQSRQACQNCDGGYINIYTNFIDTYELKLYKSIDIYKNIIIEEKGLPIINGKNGHLIIKMKVNSDINFKIKNYNLYQNINISLKESLIGFSRGIIMPDKKIIEIHSNFPINNDTLKVIESEGLYDSNQKIYGNIIIKIKVILPTSLSLEQKSLIVQNF